MLLVHGMETLLLVLLVVIFILIVSLQQEILGKIILKFFQSLRLAQMLVLDLVFILHRRLGLKEILMKLLCGTNVLAQQK